MLWTHDETGARLRLGYCTNLHPAGTLEELLAGLGRVSVPLRERLVSLGALGVGAYLAAPLARELASPQGESGLRELRQFLEQNGLDVFTFNAFPYGGFHEAGLKQEVFRPTWAEEERLAFTLDVAHIAEKLCPPNPERHIAISTHTGGFGTDFAEEGEALRQAAGRNFARAALEFAEIEKRGGPHLVLALEAEPRSLAGDTRALADWFVELKRIALETLSLRLDLDRADAEALLTRHLGWCLDACHAAVEFESPEGAVADALGSGFAFGKLQYSSALRLPEPARHPEGIEALLALDEPRYLHQVTARLDSALLRLLDLPELRAACEAEAPIAKAEEWRCHFHVPVDRDTMPGGTGLATTREHAAALLAELLRSFLQSPDSFGTSELHVEIETYTWDVLPTSVGGGSPDPVDALEREYRSVFGELEAAGWSPASSSPAQSARGERR